MKVFKNINFWLKAARLHTLPMSFMSWLVVFCWGLKQGGNVIYGFLSLFGVMFAHLGVNLIDDYFDFKKELGKEPSPDAMQSIKMQKGKCKYLIDGEATLNQTLLAIFVFFGLATLIGLFLTVVCGWPVAAIALVASAFCLLYPFLTYWGLGELAVGMTFAPLLFLGVSFVMLGSVSLVVIPLSISTGLLTVGLLHTHALMDFDYDIENNKKTLCTFLGTKMRSLVALGLMMALAYANLIMGVYYGIFPNFSLITLLTIPLAVTLCALFYSDFKTPEKLHTKKTWMGPMENWDEIVKNNADKFMLKFYISRNIMMFFTLLFCVGILFG